MRLVSAYLTLTTECNWRCRHCFLEAGTPLENELATGEMLGIVEQMAELGTEKLVFTGGEPLIRPDLLEIAQVAARLRGKGIDRLTLVTNATLLTYSNACTLGPLFDTVNVSFDGLEADHDALRGAGSFSAALQGLRYLVRAGVKPVVLITVLAGKAESANQLMDLLYQQEGVREFKFRRLWYFGRAKSAMEQEHLAENPIPVGQAEGQNRIRSLGYSINVHPDGNVYPCHLLRHPEFIAGNVRQQSLAEIYNDSVLYHTLRAWGIGCCQQVEDARGTLLELLHTKNGHLLECRLRHENRALLLRN